MKRALPLSSLLFCLVAASAHAQLYKWVGPDGKVTYSDTPPPASAARVQTKTVTTGAADTAGFPYELAEAVKNSPVTLYTTANCAPCEDARKLLKGRGVPFTEKSVISNEDLAQFKTISTEGRFPFLMIGRSKERGFEAETWNTALTAAGYPATNRLPKAYRAPQAEALAVPAKTAAAKTDSQTQSDNDDMASRSDELPPAVGKAPPGFRF